MKFIERNIEWIVAIAILLITTSLVDVIMKLSIPIIGPIFTLLKFLLIFFMFCYQLKKYGWIKNKRLFVLFFTIYNLYVLGYMTMFKVYPLESMLGIPESLKGYFISSLLIYGYLLCADTIRDNFRIKKFLYLSIPFCMLPSLWFIDFVGVDYFQDEAWGIEAKIIHPLTISYHNAPILVLALLFYDDLSKHRFVSYILTTIIVLSVGYIILEVTKRGPILWSIINLGICYYFKSKNVFKYIVITSIIGTIIYYNFDTILEWIISIAPATGRRISASIYEGSTSGRFDLQDKEGSNYILGFYQFLSSPIYGSYFRTITANPTFRGVYPHNIFIEMLMTMGILGFFPLIYYLKMAFTIFSHYFKKNNKLDINKLACFSLFLASFLELQTTGTIVLNIWFWVFFYIILNMKPYNSKKRGKIEKTDGTN